jgi:formamidopyrimidine-DNA glycosylase
MPEIKEIRKFADFIREKIKNKEILDINILNGRYKTHGPFTDFNVLKKELPLKVKEVKTKGKFLYIIFDKGLYLFSTMGLTGGWCYLEKDKKEKEKDKKDKNRDYEFSKNFEDYAKFLPENRFNTYIKNSLKHLNIEFVTKNGKEDPQITADTRIYMLIALVVIIII